jgi:phosphoribosylformylglycinamidine synthase
MNPCYGDFDPYDMAASAIDEAMRNCVAVGADPSRIAILDNFCWGYTDRPETLGSLVRAAIACQDVAVALGTPFISGKDSLNNEFSHFDADGTKHTISIPSTLLISALGQVADVGKCVTMDAKEEGNHIFIVGETKDEMGGSHYGLVHGLAGGQVPRVDALAAKTCFAAIHQAIQQGLVRSCHDLSEGGLAVAVAEMAFAGELGASIDLSEVPRSSDASRDDITLFSESNTRFLVEVVPGQVAAFQAALGDVPHARIGEFNSSARLTVNGSNPIDISIQELKSAWQAPLCDFA